LQRAIVRPLRHAEDAVYALAGGDLSHLPPAGRDDEVGHLLLALRQLKLNLTAIVGDVRANVASIDAASRGIAAGNQDLASRTEAQAASLEQTAAREIKLLIEDSVAKVGQGNEYVGAAGQTMREVVTSVQDAARIMHGITLASREQHEGIAQADAAMRALDGITRENAALVEEAAAASGKVAEQATHLVQALSVFKTAA
jgi:aerotaxis receptor